MTEPHSDEELFQQRGFGQLVGYGDTPALVVVDLVNGFTDPSKPLGAPLDAVLDETVALLTAARTAEIPIYFTTVAYEDGDLADAGVWARKMQGLMTLRSGAPEVDIDARLRRHPHESLIVKKYASAFFGTDLLSRLNSRRVDTLLLAGCTTSGCVRATAVDGVQNGFRVIVAREAVGDRSESAHEQSLFDLHAKYADVEQVSSVREYLTNHRSARRQEKRP